MSYLDESAAALKAAAYEGKIAGLEDVVAEQNETLQRFAISLAEASNNVCGSVRRLRIFLARARARGAATEEIIDEVEGELKHMEEVFRDHGDDYAE